MDNKKERISLSLKVLVDNPWSRVKALRGDTNSFFFIIHTNDSH